MVARKVPLVVAGVVLVGLGAVAGPLLAAPGASPLLRVAVSGKGTVTSSPKGIACPKRCSARFPVNARVRLTAHPASGWRFSSWSGGCLGSRACATKLVRPTTVRARFVKTPPAPPGSRSNPVPLGHPAAIGAGWTLTVTQVYPDATAAVLAADGSNPPPPAGSQDVMVAVSATYDGSGSSHFASSFALRAVGASKLAYFGDSCGVLPDPDLQLADPEVASGGTISGNAACWVVFSSDVPSLVMFTEPFVAAQQVFFALH